MKSNMPHNPHGNPDGTPIKGQEKEYFEYARLHVAENRNEIPASDFEIRLETDKANAEKEENS